mgnify:CR=1 FL=1
MTLQEMYPKEWKDLQNHKVPSGKIDEYLLKFVKKLLEEIKDKKRDEDDLGDGWSMVINLKEGEYNLNPSVYSFLFRLGDYGLEGGFSEGESEHGKMFNSPKEVEIELNKVAEKLGISLEL